jgi:hypothetical protein
MINFDLAISDLRSESDHLGRGFMEMSTESSVVHFDERSILDVCKKGF